MTTQPRPLENPEWIARKGAFPRVTGLPPAPPEIAARFPEIETGPPVSRCGDHILYSARLKEDHAPCLVLFVEAAAFLGPEHLARFLAGMAQIQTLTHPHLLTLLWTGERQGHVCLGYEAFEGTSLFEIIDRFTLDPPTVVGITGALGSALQQAHDHGIVYRDLTPGAVLLNRAGFPKLAGLGLGILLYPAEADFFQALLRRPRYLHAYLAPEQVSQQGNPPDHLTDIYALGAFTYEMLVGHPPAGLAMPPSSRASVGTYVDQVVFRAVHSSREERYASAAGFGTDIQSIYAAHSNRYQKDLKTGSAASSAAARRRKKKRMVFLVAAGLLAAGAGSAFLLNYLRPDGEGRGMADQAAADAKADALQEGLAKALSGKAGSMTKAQKEALLAVAARLIRDLTGMESGKRKTETGTTMMEMMMQADEEDLSLDTLLKMQSEPLPDSVDWRRIEELTQLLRGGRAGYQSASADAAKARKAGDARQERIELARAAGFLPGRMGLAAQAKQIRYDPLSGLEQVLRKMRNGPGGRPVRYAVRSRDLELQVDLGGNAGLTDLTPLSAFPITHLDLSRTGVSNLQPLARLPLQVLHLDHTPVTNLTAVTTGCIRLLTAEDCAVSDPGSIDQCLVMTGYRVTLRNGGLMVKTGPAHWGRVWVNSLGMAYQPISTRSPLLVSRHETRSREFEAYFRSTPPGTSSRTGLASATLKGPVRQPAEFPATRLTASDAADFCRWLTEREQSLGLIPSRASYRLLTPREWNQAASLHAACQPGGSPLTASGPLYSVRGNLPPAWDPAAAGWLPGLASPVHGPAGTFRTLTGIQDLGNGVREWGQPVESGAPRNPVFDQAPGRRQLATGSGSFSFIVPDSTQVETSAAQPDLGFRLVLQLPPVHALEE